MSDAFDLQQRYIEIRKRLRRPPNAVVDQGIDLRRNRLPPTKGTPTPVPLTEKARPFHEIRVFISEQCRPPKTIDVGMILRAVAHHYRVRIDDIKGRSRHATVVEPRHVAIFLALRLTTRSSVALAKDIDRDHSSILHARDKMILRIEAGEPVSEVIQFLEKGIKAGHYV
jgi:hypothetical protein